MVPLKLTCLHCLQHSFFEHLFNLYNVWPFDTVIYFEKHGEGDPSLSLTRFILTILGSLTSVHGYRTNELDKLNKGEHSKHCYPIVMC